MSGKNPLFDTYLRARTFINKNHAHAKRQIVCAREMANCMHTFILKLCAREMANCMRTRNGTIRGMVFCQS